MAAQEKTTALVLPITDIETLELQGSSTIGSWADGASKTELAAVFLIQKVPTLSADRKNVAVLLERALSDVLTVIQSPDALSDFRKTVSSTWSQDEFNEGLRLLEREQVGLLNEEERISDLLNNDGTWNFNHVTTLAQTRDPFVHELEIRPGYPSQFTEPQGRIITQALADLEESVHIQGTAGGGKTHLVRALVEAFGADKTLLLAQTRPQLNALVNRIGNPHVRAETFASLSYQMLMKEPGLAQAEIAKRSSSQYLVSDQDIARQFSMQQVATLVPDKVAEMGRKTITSFCNSSDTQIGEHHLPRTADRLTVPNKQVLVAYARRMWSEIESPSSKEFMLPLRGYHRIKMLSLRGIQIPEGVTHVIVDESHELSGSMVQILDASPMAVITLGDQYQRLSGTIQSRRQSIRTREIHQNVRAGRQIESVLNPIMEKHPASTMTPIVGNAMKRTFVSFYDKPTVPDHPTMILVRDEWSLLEWMQRLSHSQARFAILPGAHYSLKSLMKGCIDLFQLGIRSSHPYLFRYPSWDSLADSQQSNNAFQRIARMLKKGYTHNDFDNSFASMVPLDKAKITLGRVDDAKNMEVDSVVLAPELLESIDGGSTPVQLANKLSAIYTAASRARYELIVPGYLRDWLEDQ